MCFGLVVLVGWIFRGVVGGCGWLILFGGFYCGGFGCDSFSFINSIWYMFVGGCCLVDFVSGGFSFVALLLFIFLCVCWWICFWWIICCGLLLLEFVLWIRLVLFVVVGVVWVGFLFVLIVCSG